MAGIASSRFLGAIAVATVLMALAGADTDARADNNTTIAEARSDYEAGAAAYDHKDWLVAARRFARADEHVPNPRALQLAMASALHLNDAALAMNLVERAESRAVDGSLAELAKRLRGRFANDAGRIRIACPPNTASASCQGLIDGHAIDVSLPRWVMPGAHHVQIGSIDKDVRVAAGAVIEIAPTMADLESPSPPPQPDAPEPPPAAATPQHRANDTLKEEDHRDGISPVFFWTGLVLTGAAAATSTVLTVSSARRHDDFQANPNPDTQAAGQAAQTRSIVGWSITGGLLVTTIVLAFITDFHGHGASSSQTSAMRRRWATARGATF